MSALLKMETVNKHVIIFLAHTIAPAPVDVYWTLIRKLVEVRENAKFNNNYNYYMKGREPEWCKAPIVIRWLLVSHHQPAWNICSRIYHHYYWISAHQRTELTVPHASPRARRPSRSIKLHNKSNRCNAALCESIRMVHAYIWLIRCDFLWNYIMIIPTCPHHWLGENLIRNYKLTNWGLTLRSPIYTDPLGNTFKIILCFKSNILVNLGHMLVWSVYVLLHFCAFQAVSSTLFWVTSPWLWAFHIVQACRSFSGSHVGTFIVWLKYLY